MAVPHICSRGRLRGCEPILIGPLFVQAVSEGVEFVIGKFASPVEPRLASLKSVVPRVLIFVGV